MVPRSRSNVVLHQTKAPTTWQFLNNKGVGATDGDFGCSRNLLTSWTRGMLCPAPGPYHYLMSDSGSTFFCNPGTAVLGRQCIVGTCSVLTLSNCSFPTLWYLCPGHWITSSHHWLNPHENMLMLMQAHHTHSKESRFGGIIITTIKY